MNNANRIKLPPYLVTYLNYRLIRQFEADFELEFKKKYQRSTEAALYGYDNADPYRIRRSNPDALRGSAGRSIKQALATSERVRAVWNTLTDQEGRSFAEVDILKGIDGKYLWKKKEVAKKEAVAAISIKDSYLRIFLAYLKLDYTSLDSLEQAYEADFDHYVGLYLSYTGFCIRSLIFSISKFPINDGRYVTRMNGVHVREKFNDIESYNGTGVYTNRFLHVRLRGQEYGKVLNLILAENEQEIEGRPFLRGVLQGTTTNDDRIFAWELIFIKEKKERLEKYKTKVGASQGPISLDIIDKPTLQTICYYLSLHRNVIAVGATEVNLVNRLTANKHTVSTFTQLSGTYRLWNFSYGQDTIAQSRFEIKEDGTARLFPFFPIKKQKIADDSGEASMRIVLKEQNSVLDISRVNVNREKHKIIATTYSSGINIVNVAMFNFEENHDAIITGSFSTLGFDGYGNIAGYFVMQRVESTKEVEPCEFTFEQILQEAATGPQKQLLESLVQLQNRNVWQKVRAQANAIDGLIDAVNVKS